MKSGLVYLCFSTDFLIEEADEIPDAPEWMRNLKFRLQMKAGMFKMIRN